MERIKNIVILVLLVASIIFGLKWFWGGNDVSKEKLKNLTEKFNVLESQKKQVDKDIVSWKDKYKIKEIAEQKLKIEIVKSKKDIAIAIDKANKTKLELDKYKIKLDKSKKEIDEYTKNPPKLSEDELLKSLRKKLN
jgi:chromosome segregation ATPase